MKKGELLNPDLRVCVICGQEFLAKRYNQICCSEECSQVRKKKVDHRFRSDKPKKIVMSKSMQQLYEIAKRGRDYPRIVREMEREGLL